MANKKSSKPKAEEQIMQQQQIAQAQGDQAQILADNLRQVEQIDEQTRVIQQEAENKMHDTEFSPYAIGGAQENLGIIGEDEVKEAMEVLQKYKESKTNLENKLKTNEEFWKMNHWQVMYNQKEKKDDKRIKPKSAWLVNTIINKHADAMDNFPEPNILPRSQDDEDTAKALSKIIPVILEQNDYEETYSRCAWDKNKNGSSCTGIFWNNDKSNGLGDIDIRGIDLMRLYWKSGIEDIQDSPNVFYVQMMDNDEIHKRYPELKEAHSTNAITALDAYHYGEQVDTSDMSPVVDWYYKKRMQFKDEQGIPQMRTILHYCKFCNGEVIYASENDPEYVDTGWYSHGQYPFVVDTLYPVKASLVGMGFIDLVADDQIYTDKLQQAILENAIANARPRTVIRSDSGLNEEEYLNEDNPIIHTAGNLGEESFRQLKTTPLASIYQNVYLQKIQEMKDTSGNTASSQGQASSVTSASGIASLQEAAGKLSRDSSNASYRSFRKIVYQIIELIRQFYTETRCFRIIGDDGQPTYEDFDNRGLKPQSQGSITGQDANGNNYTIDLGNRLPIMDIQVKPQKRSAYSKETQNQTALSLYGQGFFAPNNADAALACLNMMDFDGIEDVKNTIAANGQLYQQVMMLTQIIAQAGLLPQDAVATGTEQEVQKGSTKSSNGSLSAQAANATRQSTAPRT
jgi:hypothetical protein